MAKMRPLANRLTLLSHRTIADTQEKYSLFDPDDDGTLPVEKLRALTKANIPGMTDEVFINMCLVNKIDPSGRVTFAQFIVLLNATITMPAICDQEESEQSDLESMTALFTELDKDKSGYVDVKTVINVLRNTGARLTEEEATQLELHMNIVGCVVNNKVNYRAFLRNILAVTPISLI